MKSRLFAFLVLGSILAPAAWAAAPDWNGNWMLSTVAATTEQVVLIVKFESQKGDIRPVSVIQRNAGKAKGAQQKAEITDFKIEGDAISFVVKQGPLARAFSGVIAKDGKSVFGSFGADPRPQRAKLLPTDKTEILAKDVFVRLSAPAYLKAADMQSKTMVLSLQAQNEKDADKKKALVEKVKEAKKEADATLPGLWRAAVEAHAGEPAGYDAAMALLRGGSKYKVNASEAQSLVDALEKRAAPYGPRFMRSTHLQIAEALVNDKMHARIASGAAEKVANALSSADPDEYQGQVLALWKNALINASDTARLDEINPRIAKLDEKQDAEYAKKMPPFKPERFKGRENKQANRVAVMELFTGAQCPPCVAADVAFDALEQAYPPEDLILIQYHLHIPGPDPLTNAASEARMEFYKKVHSGVVRPSTPTTLFNGSPKAGGGGSLKDAQGKCGKYREVIDPILETKTPIALTGKATRTGNRVSAKVEVQGADPKEELVVRFVLIEDKIKYVGGNKLRFHHHVVRAIPETAGPVAGKETSHSMQIDLTKLHQELTEYLDGSARKRSFPNAARPLDFQGLKVIALVQNDKTGEILQAAQFEIKDEAN